MAGRRAPVGRGPRRRGGWAVGEGDDGLTGAREARRVETPEVSRGVVAPPTNNSSQACGGGAGWGREKRRGG